MRTLLLTILVSITILSARAQSHLPIYTPGFGYTQWQPSIPFQDSLQRNNKWQLVHSASISAGYIFGNGGISYLAAPFSLALVHPLTNNLSAFGAVTAAPVLFSVNRLYTDPAVNQFNPNNFSRTNLGLNGRIEAGLMYTNDAHTFSISGSVGVERGRYPVYQPARVRPANAH